MNIKEMIAEIISQVPSEVRYAKKYMELAQAILDLRYPCPGCENISKELVDEYGCVVCHGERKGEKILAVRSENQELPDGNYEPGEHYRIEKQAQEDMLADDWIKTVKE